ncbi:MAG: DNA polymerase III subunit delta [Anaerolineae bacterium]|nr:DNA polymerase III subunit delta [Anaerolineae bacterium]
MFYILHGDEEFARAEEVAKLKAQIAEDGMGDLNITIFDGRTVTLTQLANACDTVPFLTQRRLVIVENLLQRLQSRGSPSGADRGASSAEEEVQKLLDYLPTMPDTTRLVFVEDRRLPRSHPILKWAIKSDDGYVREFSALDGGGLQAWIRHRAHLKGVEVQREAVAKLATYVGDDLRLLDHELEKLAAYEGYDAAIDDQAVEALVSAAQEADIFALVDALGMRQQRQALEHLQRLIANGANALYLLAMIARQIRLLISAKDLAENEGLGPAEIGKKLSISHRFIINKIMRQSRQFEADELEALLRGLLEIDQGIKTGRVHEELALERLIVHMCQRRAR